ncbi:MAG: Csu type fimbrial protein [Pseudomarimonas sp.]
MKKFNANPVSISLCLLAAALSPSAFAATANANLGVSASVSNNCLISTSPVAFGAYDPVGTNAAAALDGTGTVTVTCTLDAATTVRLGQGVNAAGGSTDAAPLRRMIDGAELLTYALFSDAGRTAVWGNDASVDVDHTGTGTAVNLTVYGRVAAAQNVSAGSYADTVVATVEFF